MDSDDEKKATKERVYDALIEKHIDFLEERIDPDSQLLDKLRASGALTWKEISKIKDRSPSYERNSQLLDYILKKREGHRLVEALQEAQQMHIANYLIADAADIILRAILDFDPRQMSNKEKYELQEITPLKKHRRKRNLWGDDEVLKNHSDEMFYSEDGSDRRKAAVALSFEKGSKMETIPPANIGDNVGWWMVRHLESGQIGFIPRNRVVIDFASEDQTVKTTIDELPLELLDIVLQKSYLLYALQSGRDEATDKRRRRRRRDEFLINRLSSVDFCWSQRLQRSRFKRNIRRHLSEFHEESKTGIAVICRNNRSYLEENIRHKGLTKRLRSDDYLTDVEARLLNRQILNQEKAKSFNRNNNPDLLHLMRHFDEKSLSTVVSCLRKRSQRLAAMVAENGGAVFKAIAPGRRTAKRSLVHGQDQLVQSINDLRDKTKPRSRETEKVMSQLSDDDIEILSSVDDRRQTVVWIWCQSQKAVERIQRISDESSNLLYSFIGLATLDMKSSSSDFTQPSAVHMCRDQFKRCIELRSTVIVNFTERIEVGEAEYVWGIAKLRNEIYVLCQSYSTSPHVIRIFKDRNPFGLEKRIETKVIKFPVDIGSCEKENCVFVIDQGEEKCVWKITRERDDERRIMKWLRLDCPPRILSVSSVGHLLIVTWKDRSSILSIYGLDAKLLRSIHLSSDVMHAVETSIGNFIVLSKDWKEAAAGESGSFAKACSELWSICELTRDGQKVVRRFISSGELQQPNSYVYLLLDSDDRVLVADRWNNRVILLDSDLRWNRILCPTNEEDEKIIFQPKRLCYDEKSNQLFVGGNLIGQGVNVYTLKRKFSRSFQQD